MTNEIIIGIDGNEANIPNRVGVGQYAYQVLIHIYESQKYKLKFKIYLKEQPLSDLPDETSWWQYRIIGPRKFWTQIALPLNLFLQSEKPNIFFTPSHYAPRFSPCPVVISIMDLSFVHFPQMFTKKDLWQLKKWTAYSVKKAQKIFTISNFSKEDIVSYYGVEPQKVVVTYPGYDKNKYQISKIKDQKHRLKIKNKYKIYNDYILFVGTLQPRKNIIRLIEAFNLSMKQLNNETMKLVIIGKKGWLYDEIFRKVNELGLKDDVIFTDYVNDDNLPSFYRGAQCLVLPSLYEGFGFPVVEAMACGCPVIVSNVSSLPEIAGNSGMFVDAYRVESIAGAITEMCYDKAKREEFVKRGLLQVKKFSWEKCAEKILEELICLI